MAASPTLPEFSEKGNSAGSSGGLTKCVWQRLVVGAHIGIQRHSETGDVDKLRHDLRNGPAHVFGDHCHCDPQFCRHVPSQSEDATNTATDDESNTSSSSEEVSPHSDF